MGLLYVEEPVNDKTLTLRYVQLASDLLIPCWYLYENNK
jgi:hypothetical protein